MTFALSNVMPFKKLVSKVHARALLQVFIPRLFKVWSVALTVGFWHASAFAAPSGSANTSFSETQTETFPEAFPRETAQLAKILMARSLLPSTLNQMLPVGPLGSLVVIGIAEPHELASVKKFAELFHTEFGLTLVLISQYKGMNTPGFDGVILDAQRNFIGNFSLKSSLSSEDSDLTDPVRIGIEKIHEFSRFRRWASMLKYWSEDEAEFRKRVRTAIELLSILQIGKERSDYVFLDLPRNSTLTAEELKFLAPEQRSSPRIPVVITNQENYLFATGEGTFQTPRPVCANSFALSKL